MTLSFSGIENVEFYSGHYLDSVLEGDLQTLFRQWADAEKDDNRQAPWRALDALNSRYFQARQAAAEETDADVRLQHARDFHARLLAALGYEYQPTAEPLEGDTVLPTLLSLSRDQRPFLWVLDAPFPPPRADGHDPLDGTPSQAQLPHSLREQDPPPHLPDQTYRELLEETLFRGADGPRWVLFLSGNEALLCERNKWLQGRLLRFSFDELLRRRDTDALKAVCGLLHKDVLAPDSGLCLHDTLDENSHKHAFAVSGDLKHGIRRALELLANEAIYYRGHVQKQALFQTDASGADDQLARALTTECLTWLYRLLFLFYVEARSEELNAVPMRSATYRKGYSLEGLRDLELVPLHTEKAQNGWYLHDSLQTLFAIVQDGFPENALPPKDSLFAGRLPEPAFSEHGLSVIGLRSPLFDDSRLTVLKGVRFRNKVLQQILQLLSLSQERGRKQRGRISYAQLGINQLGAVYESLLSYTGFFAKEELYEVANADENQRLAGKSREDLQSWFVPKSRCGDYQDAEIVKDEHGRKVVHAKGTFLYRLAGRHREKSASYYTPEVLTRCLVKYSLKELLYDEEGKPKLTAKEILGLTVCEPAMGSGAFLLEAVDQLADAYLVQAQKERGAQIPSDQYQAHKRRVKARLATSNCHGVDLNPTAVELAKVSLWLGTMHERGKCPWFGLRLAVGNSLIGARRQVFKVADVVRKGSKENPNWLGLVPVHVPLRAAGETNAVGQGWLMPPRPKGTVYHFLLPAQGMAPFDQDKVIKDLAPEALVQIKAWRRKFCAPFSREEAARLEKLSDSVDRLWVQVARERAVAVRESGDRIPVWGEEVAEYGSVLLVRDQEEVAQALEASSSAYRRLKLVMDLWCALWFWPLKKAGLLPEREVWLRVLELVVLGQVDARVVHAQGDLFRGSLAVQAKLPLDERKVGGVTLAAQASGERLSRLKRLSEEFATQRQGYAAECGLADVEKVIAAEPMLGVVEEVAGSLQFHHWELRFAEVFAGRGGFDLILGNPPWILVSFDEAGVISDFEPWIATRQLSAPAVAQRRQTLLATNASRAVYLQEYEVQTGAQEFLGAGENYPLLLGMKSNLYKNFVTRAWDITRGDGVCGFVHPEGLYDDPKGGATRAALYPRLRHHYRFVNELKLFPDIGNLSSFGLHVYGPPRASPRFVSASNLVHPSTIDASWDHDGRGATPGIKRVDGTWDTSGHRKRLVRVNHERLQLFARIYDDAGTPSGEARLPVLHSDEVVSVLERFVAQSQRLGDVADRYYATQHWNETNAQDDGTLRRHTDRPEHAASWILQGPHFHTGTPFYQTPNEGCSSHRDYTSIDLTAIPADYLPRTNYVPACDAATYLARTPKWKDRPVTDFYRHVNRRAISPTGERTLISALLPPEAAHIDSVLSVSADADLVLDLLYALPRSCAFERGIHRR